MPCLGHVLICLTYFVTPVVKLPQIAEKIITPTVKKEYELYFGCKVGDQTRAVRHIHVAFMFAVFTWLAHWHSPVNAFRCPYGRIVLPIATSVQQK